MEVMVVEDESIIRMGIVRMLNRISKDVHVTEALNGEDALNKITDKVDVVMTDWNMPIMNGPTLLKKVHQLYPNTKLIILSGYNSPKPIEEMENIPHTFVTKPVTNGVLANILLHI